jgi:quercetin dioxygenase-like cupin family protein
VVIDHTATPYQNAGDIPSFRKTSPERGNFMTIDPRGGYAINTHEIPWLERFNEKLGCALFRKELYEDPDNGMLIRLVRYPAGVINPGHTHPCGHGMFVLEGTLVTHRGSYGPGSFVWFPEGEVMEHGASAEGDVTVVFITNKAFRLDYV